VDLDTPLDVVKQVMIDNDGRDVFVMGPNDRVAGRDGRYVFVELYV